MLKWPFKVEQNYILLIYALAYTIGLADDHLPKICLPKTYKDLMGHHDCKNIISMAHVIKIIVLIVGGFMFKDHIQFSLITVITYQFIEDFFKGDECEKTFEQMGGVKPYIFGSVIHNVMYGV
jgi:hypothetical protein